MKGFITNANLPIPTFKDVFTLLDDELIFSYYIPDLVTNISIKSPLGQKDDNPSFSVFWSYSKSKFLFKEHRYDYVGDCVDFVRHLFGYAGNTMACMKIFADFGIEGFHIEPNIVGVKVDHAMIKPLQKRNNQADIKITVREWKQYDLDYWGKVAITLRGLQFARIYPIEYYFLNGSIRKADKYAYAYLEVKDKKHTFKIYQPFNKVGVKWRSNNDASVWELWHMLPKTGEFLIITKSRKDALSIMETTKIPALALQAEGTVPKDKVIDELKGRFKNIFLFYDNDFDATENWGQNYSAKLSNQFNLPSISIPDIYESKDYTDFIIKYSPKDAKKLLWHLIKRELLR